MIPAQVVCFILSPLELLILRYVFTHCACSWVLLLPTLSGCIISSRSHDDRVGWSTSGMRRGLELKPKRASGLVSQLLKLFLMDLHKTICIGAPAHWKAIDKMIMTAGPRNCSKMCNHFVYPQPSFFLSCICILWAQFNKARLFPPSWVRGLRDFHLDLSRCF